MPVRTLTFYTLLGLLSFSALAAEPVIRLSEPVAVTDTHEIFGSPLEPDPEAPGLADLLANEDAFLEKEVIVSARIDQVCQKKGCFFIAQDKDTVARVRFKDYSFFVPTDSSGKTVTIKGVLHRQELSQEQAAHYAADLGESGAGSPGFEYALMASAVAIPRNSHD